jgi:hypothetical protein
MLQTAVQYAHQLIRETVQEKDVVVDATMGNGNDTLLLAKTVGKSGTVHAFDIQKIALSRTEALLGVHHAQTQLHLEGHEHAGGYLQNNLKFAIFNLGYLPKSDKQIITKANTTIQAIEGMLPHLVQNGKIVLILYYGHAGGVEEKEQVIEYVQNLDQHMYQVLQYAFLNQKTSPPILLCIEKRHLHPLNRKNSKQ